jgi:CRP-like cAMP-binding protein
LRELGGTGLHFGLQEATEAIGIVLGSFAMAQLADRIRAGQWLAISYLSRAALTGSMRMANVITEEESEFLVVPAPVLKELSRSYAGMSAMFQNVMAERLRMIDLPTTGFNQQLLRELRTSQPDMQEEPILG